MRYGFSPVPAVVDDQAVAGFTQAFLGRHRRGLKQQMAEERLILSCGSIANAHAAYDATVEYVQERKMFGQMLADFQNTRFKLADMRTEIDVGYAFIDRCVEEHNLGKLTAEDAAKCKLWISEMENRVTDECVQLHGGNGFMMEYEVCRRYAAARVSRIYAGTSEIMREIISRSIGLDPRKQNR